MIDLPLPADRWDINRLTEERTAAESSGWRRIRLPGSLLRSETAVLAGLALAGRAIDSAAGRADNSSTPQEAP